jgi:hypothetical protein
MMCRDVWVLRQRSRGGSFCGLHGSRLRTNKHVLREHVAGLQTYEVRSHVEKRLGRSLPKSTVKDALASNPVFARIAKGRYRLKQ